MEFTTTLDRHGERNTGFTVPPDVVASFASGKRPPVVVTINGYTWRTTVAVYGGVFMIGVSAEARTRAGVEGGDTIDVRVDLDTEPRVVEVPDDLAAALVASPSAKTFYESLSYSNQRRHVLAIEGRRHSRPGSAGSPRSSHSSRPASSDPHDQSSATTPRVSTLLGTGMNGAGSVSSAPS